MKPEKLAAGALALTMLAGSLVMGACGAQQSSAPAQSSESSENSESQLSKATYDNSDITMPDVTTPEVPELEKATYSNAPIDYESALNEAKDHVIYFNDKLNWGQTYIYYWSDADKKMTEWPGEKMEEFESVWRYKLPAEAEYIIFSNGALQTRDIPFDENQNCYSQSSQKDQDNSYYVEDWQGNVINSERVDPKGKYN